MKKSINKLTLNKITISNLDATEMSNKVGGAKPKTTFISVLMQCSNLNTCNNC